MCAVCAVRRDYDILKLVSWRKAQYVGLNALAHADVLNKLSKFRSVCHGVVIRIYVRALNLRGERVVSCKLNKLVASLYLVNSAVANIHSG